MWHRRMRVRWIRLEMRLSLYSGHLGAWAVWYRIGVSCVGWYTASLSPDPRNERRSHCGGVVKSTKPLMIYEIISQGERTARIRPVWHINPHGPRWCGKNPMLPRRLSTWQGIEHSSSQSSFASSVLKMPPILLFLNPLHPSISRHRIHLWIEAYTSFPNRGWRGEDDTGHPRSMVMMSFHHAWLPTCTLLPWLLPHSRYVQWPGLFFWLTIVYPQKSVARFYIYLFINKRWY